MNVVDDLYLHIKDLLVHRAGTWSCCMHTQLTQVPRSPNLAIFVTTTTTEPITLPLAYVHGIIKLTKHLSYRLAFSLGQAEARPTAHKPYT